MLPDGTVPMSLHGTPALDLQDFCPAFNAAESIRKPGPSLGTVSGLYQNNLSWPVMSPTEIQPIQKQPFILYHLLQSLPPTALVHLSCARV